MTTTATTTRFDRTATTATSTDNEYDRDVRFRLVGQHFFNASAVLLALRPMSLIRKAKGHAPSSRLDERYRREQGTRHAAERRPHSLPVGGSDLRSPRLLGGR